MILVNWSAFNGNPALEQMRCCFVAMSIFMLVMMILMAGTSSSSDILGHLGGAIFGLLYGLAFYPRPRSDTGRKTRLVGFALFSSVSILMIGLLFGLHAK